MIRFQNVSLTLGKKQILDHFNLKIRKGEKVVLSAPSGSGKTCLLKLLMGFIDADQGRIFFNGEKIIRENVQKIRSKIGYISQDIDFPNGRVDEVFRDILNLTGSYMNNFHRELLVKKLEVVNLSGDILSKNTSDISGTERQRLGWALTMLLDRPVLLLDEPTSALDSRQTQFFVDYAIFSGKTVICATHDREWIHPNVKVIPEI